MSKWNVYKPTPIQLLPDGELSKRSGFPAYVGRECAELPGFYECLTLTCKMNTSRMIPILWGRNPKIAVMHHGFDPNIERWYASPLSTITNDQAGFSGQNRVGGVSYQSDRNAFLACEKLESLLLQNGVILP